MVVLTYDSKVKVHSVPPDKKRVSGDKKPQQRIVEKVQQMHVHAYSASTPVRIVLST